MKVFFRFSHDMTTGICKEPESSVCLKKINIGDLDTEQ